MLVFNFVSYLALNVTPHTVGQSWDGDWPSLNNFLIFTTEADIAPAVIIIIIIIINRDMRSSLVSHLAAVHR